MKILIACDKFKGSISAQNVCKALDNGIRSIISEVDINSQALADGGDGTLSIISEYLDLEKIELEVTGPTGKNIKAYYFVYNNTAYVELAIASGLTHVPLEERSPSNCSSLGTGELINHAIRKGCKEIYLFLGGSSTNDAGIGVAAGLGFQFLDERSEILDPIGNNLHKIDRINITKSILEKDTVIRILCDVDNPMYGDRGAARVFAKQKGASENEIEKLEEGMQRFSKVLQSYNKDFDPWETGMGAAGGIACSLKSLCDATIQSGFEFVKSFTSLEKEVQEADVIITGEGCIDHTSLKGKVTGSMWQLSKKYKKKLIFVAGLIELNNESFSSYPQYSCIDYAKNVKDSMDRTKELLFTIGQEIAKDLKLDL